MYHVINVLQNAATKYFCEFTLSYIDPGTMQHVFTFIGPILAFFAIGAGLIVSAFVFLHHRSLAWFKKTSRLKLFLVWLAIVSVLDVVVAIVYKFILYFTQH